MTNKEFSNREGELLDLLAEGFLQQGRSISYTDLDGLPALAVDTEGHEPEIFISLSPESLTSVLSKIISRQNLTIAVFTKEEQQSLQSKLQQLKIHNVRIYPLSEQRSPASKGES